LLNDPTVTQENLVHVLIYTKND